MAFDIKDPYDAADCWFGLMCEECAADLECPAAEGLKHFDRLHARGQHAKRLGWHVVDASTSSVEYRILCPACTHVFGLILPDPSLRREPHPSVKAIVQLDSLGLNENGAIYPAVAPARGPD